MPSPWRRMSRQLKPISQSRSDGPEQSKLFEKNVLVMKYDKASLLFRHTDLIVSSLTNGIKQQTLLCLGAELQVRGVSVKREKRQSKKGTDILIKRYINYTMSTFSIIDIYINVLHKVASVQVSYPTLASAVTSSRKTTSPEIRILKNRLCFHSACGFHKTYRH